MAWHPTIYLNFTNVTRARHSLPCNDLRCSLLLSNVDMPRCPAQTNTIVKSSCTHKDQCLQVAYLLETPINHQILTVGSPDEATVVSSFNPPDR